ncbi:Cyclic nucleotide-binding domain-containing protein [Fodinibius salinus]|uniref:Cyclic nucleotide-binding domain-containing protein n=1 Tax=Fodinibius salinus TaxID=860790 RepID=A0A5D3YQ16_9BACT|nr:cyclic nucleotide-binding domain-containing protein [Fodinibius salinus]TYP95139.1 Cyclic nucleotide-binding domain-containing protein [Fodinibius salinus]
MLGSEKFNKLKNQSEIIFNSRFLQNLTTLERSEFLQYCHRRRYKKNDHIYYQGDPGTGMYFIEDGKVELIVEHKSDGDDSKQSRTITAPESFGALSIGYELRRISSAKCLTDCILMGFFKPDFETLKKRHPSIAVKFMETLAMIAMKQLEIVTNELKEVSTPEHAFALQFGTYITGEDE